MKKKTKYSNEPIGILKVVRDVLPPPEQLVLKEERVKVTIALSKTSVMYFKKTAKQHRTQYQKMIRNLLDYYSSHADEPTGAGSSTTRSNREV